MMCDLLSPSAASFVTSFVTDLSAMNNVQAAALSLAVEAVTSSGFLVEMLS